MYNYEPNVGRVLLRTGSVSFCTAFLDQRLDWEGSLGCHSKQAVVPRDEKVQEPPALFNILAWEHCADMSEKWATVPAYCCPP